MKENRRAMCARKLSTPNVTMYQGKMVAETTQRKAGLVKEQYNYDIPGHRFMFHAQLFKNLMPKKFHISNQAWILYATNILKMTHL